MNSELSKSGKIIGNPTDLNPLQNSTPIPITSTYPIIDLSQSIQHNSIGITQNLSPEILSNENPLEIQSNLRNLTLPLQNQVTYQNSLSIENNEHMNQIRTANELQNPSGGLALTEDNRISLRNLPTPTVGNLVSFEERDEVILPKLGTL